MKLFIPAIACLALNAGAADPSFTSYADVKPVLDAQQGHLPAQFVHADAAAWKAWSRRQDQAIRARLQQGELDSMVNLLLFGTSFTTQPRIRIADISQASRVGVLRTRVDDLVAGLRQPGGNERLVFLRALLLGKGVDLSGNSPQAGVFVYNNLQRVLQERKTLAARGAAAKAADLLDRSSLFSDRGVSLDTSILPNFGIDQALIDLKQRGVLREGQVARVAVVGPGLDFIDKNEESGYDYYPQQTLQPFALYDSLVRLGLARNNSLSLSVFDISSHVLDHIKGARERAARGAGYVIQLPRDIARPWPRDLIGYWRSLGSAAGMEVAPIAPPKLFQGLETRAVRIDPQVVLACQGVDLNIVLQRIDLPPSDRFDLIVGTNIFIYYDAFEQMLALENAGAMLKAGGLLLTNDRLPEVPSGTMRQSGITDVPYTVGDVTTHEAVGWYQRQ